MISSSTGIYTTIYTTSVICFQTHRKQSNWIRPNKIIHLINWHQFCFLLPYLKKVRLKKIRKQDQAHKQTNQIFRSQKKWIKEDRIKTAHKKLNYRYINSPSDI